MVTIVLPSGVPDEGDSVSILEYLDAEGRSPFSRWFAELNAAAAARVTIALYRFKQGNKEYSKKMALTKEFRETVYRRAQRDAAFRKALLTEAVNAYLGGDEATGKAVLRDVINATIGFEQLAAAVHKPSKSLHRMLGPRGNPNTTNFFTILQVLQEKVGVTLRVRAA